MSTADGTGDGTPVFVDTSAFYAWFDDDDAHHASADATFAGIKSGALPYGPVYTTRYVLAELGTLTHLRLGYADAVTALASIIESETFNLLSVWEPLFTDAFEAFSDANDTDIEFFDHLSAIVAQEQGIDYVFTFDEDFTTLGFTRVPADTGLPNAGN